MPSSIAYGSDARIHRRECTSTDSVRSSGLDARGISYYALRRDPFYCSVGTCHLTRHRPFTWCLCTHAFWAAVLILPAGHRNTDNSQHLGIHRRCVQNCGPRKSSAHAFAWLSGFWYETAGLSVRGRRRPHVPVGRFYESTSVDAAVAAPPAIHSACRTAQSSAFSNWIGLSRASSRWAPHWRDYLAIIDSQLHR